MVRFSAFLMLVAVVILRKVDGQVAKDEKTFGWVGDILFGNCQISGCRSDISRAQYCCRTGKNTRCCSYTGGNGGNGNNGGNWNNGGNNNNKAGTCPNYNGRKKRSPEQAPRGSNSGSSFGHNNGGWNNGGQGFRPGHNNNNGQGRCIRDSECPGSLKCCYLYNGYQCTQPQHYG
eukprot:GFUD01033225.1.p1 GENE.GFUD01033225.1~~GFUD01033225.1.p1  ORF type:complete len:175 (-),score=34.79 GFUD01033225.1:74-598(-)